MSVQDQIWKEAAVGKCYLEGVRAAMPMAEQQIDLMLRLARRAVPKIERLLDLGCGDGVLGRAMLTQYPTARGVFLDFSETMLAAAREKMAAMPGAAVFVCRDYGAPDWSESVRAHAPFDLIVSGLSIHHQPDVRKQSLYRELYELLVPGGLFLNLEHVASASPWLEATFDEYFIDALCRFHAARGTNKTPAEIAQEYYHRPDKAANILALVEDQCEWLRQIGFTQVDCYFKALEVALFGGVKPVVGTRP